MADENNNSKVTTKKHKKGDTKKGTDLFFIL